MFTKDTNNETMPKISLSVQASLALFFLFVKHVKKKKKNCESIYLFFFYSASRFITHEYETYIFTHYILCGYTMIVLFYDCVDFYLEKAVLSQMGISTLCVSVTDCRRSTKRFTFLLKFTYQCKFQSHHQT